MRKLLNLETWLDAAIMLFAAVVLACLMYFAGGCIHMPHTQPELRQPTAAAASVVRLDYSCGDDVWGEHLQWGMGHATGFIVDDRTVITAGHVVRCPSIPVVTATTYDGRRFAMYVERDELTFGDGRDIARLRMASGSVFGLRIGRPVIAVATPRDAVEVYTLHGQLHGVMVTSNGECELETHGHAGDSGAPVFLTNGAIVGLIAWGGDPVSSAHVRFQPITDKDVQ